MYVDGWFVAGEVFRILLLSLLIGCLGGIWGMLSNKRPLLWCIIITASIMTVFACIAFVGFGTSWTTETDVYSVGDTSLIHGKFFLGSGTVDEIPVYIYYYKLPNGGYKLGYIPADKTTIYMDNDDRPYLKTDYTKYAEIYTEHELHVPNGTIIQSFVLDARLK